MTQNQKSQEQRLSAAVPFGFDAQAIPIHEICADQPIVAVHHLHPANLKSRFLNPPAWQPEITDENRQVIAAGIIQNRQAAGKITQAAVLIALLIKSDGLSVLLTQKNRSFA